MLKALLSGLFIASMVFAAGAQADYDEDGPQPEIDFGSIKFSGACQIDARIGNWREFLEASYKFEKNVIGFGIARCKDGTSAHFMLKEHQIDTDDAGIHLANLVGYMDGTASDVYGLYGYFKSVSSFPFWWWGGFLPMGSGVLGMMKSPTSKPLVMLGLAMGFDISDHKGAMEVIPASKKKVEALMKKWNDQPMKQSLSDIYGSYGETEHSP